MKKIMMIFTILALVGCKKCVQYDSKLIQYPMMVGKTMVMATTRQCLKYEE